jgi:predicted phosphate transport protein (TIGR00153 family)
MEQVAKCITKMGESLDAVEQQKWDQIERLADEASHLEHEADQIKDEVRSRLLRRFFMPVDRSQLIEILSIQDSLADTAEDVSILMTIRRLVAPSDMVQEFRRFRELNVVAFEVARGIIGELDELVESGFGGAEAEKIRNLVRDVAYTEHQVDVLQRRLLKEVFSDERGFSAADMNMWIQLIKELAHLSNLSENLANCIQMTLSMK